MFDTPLLGRLLTERGAGLTIPDREMTTDAVREHVRRLIEEPGFGRESGRLRAEMLAMPAPNDAVPELERRTADIRSNR
jgi:UDP:flavonoid glycosyltransferase YjiC (YdhE family)